MKKTELLILKDKHIRIFLRNNIFYSGKIIDIYEESFLFLDKFNSTILVDLSTVERVEVLR